MRSLTPALIASLPLMLFGCADSVGSAGYQDAPFCDGRSACADGSTAIDLDGNRCADRCEADQCETFAPVDCGGRMPVDSDGDGCARECPTPTDGKFCGGIAGFPCGEGEFCDYALGDYCGYADAGGTCRKIPGACTLEYAPICGCDGKTYGNECAANAAGVSIRSWGPCEIACPAYYPICEGGAEPVDNDGDGCALECPTRGMSCGGNAPDGPHLCPQGSFCDYEPGDYCGWADAPGTCQSVPDACTEEYAPVCGCDNATYSNRCDAAAHSVGILHEGACK